MIGSAPLVTVIRAVLNKGINHYGVLMKKLYLYAKVLVPVLTAILLVIQIPDAAFSLWQHWQQSDFSTWSAGEIPLPDLWF